MYVLPRHVRLPATSALQALPEAHSGGQACAFRALQTLRASPYSTLHTGRQHVRPAREQVSAQRREPGGRRVVRWDGVGGG